jgi:hypothetical protein
MTDASLLTLWDEVRGKTLALVQVPQQDSRWTLEGTHNSILWHAGHIFCVVERLVMVGIEGEVHMPPAIPEGWWQMFGWESRPETIHEDQWPALADVVVQLRTQHARLRSVLEGLSPDRLSLPLHVPTWGWHGAPLRRVVIHAFHDEACHSGEIWLLRKLLRQNR